MALPRHKLVMHCFCLPEAFPGHVRRALPSIHSQSSPPAQLPLCNKNSRLSPLESTLASHLASVHSKRLTPPPIPLESALTRKPGVGAPFPVPSLSTRYYAPPQPNPAQPAHSLPLYPQSIQALPHSFRHIGGWTHPQSRSPDKAKGSRLVLYPIAGPQYPGWRGGSRLPENASYKMTGKTAQPPVWPVAVNQEK